jgi:PadR family transcriptional regulator PadR
MAFREDLATLVLSCLSPGPAHGYELCKRIRALSEEVLAVAEGKLYPALHSLEQDGDISAIWVPQGNKPPRKVYELTEQGRKTLRLKQAEWATFSKAVDSVVGQATAGLKFSEWAVQE